jgi:major membrane immunogen (membrane-anchored lipoprotein)
MTKNQEQYKQELMKKIKEMQDKKAYGVIKVHIQNGNINKVNVHYTEEIKPDNGE